MAAVVTSPNTSSSSGIPLHHARVLNNNTGQRKKEIKAMIASVQNVPQALTTTTTQTTPSSVTSESPSQKSSPTSKMLAQHVKDETLLKVKIKSKVENGKFFVPVSLLVDRELEMRKSAKDFGIRTSRWSKSRLFREWRQQLEADIINEESTPTTEICISLNPEEDCLTSNQSHSFEWQPWLTTCIRAYYNTGTIRIPDECVGSDILLALEYFGILYSPDQLVFDSFGGYLRVKLWSDYFTHRAKMADWVVQKLVTTPSRHSHCFVTSPNMEENCICLVNSQKQMQILDGDLALDEARYGTTPSRAVVHEFFNDDDQKDEQSSPEKMDGLMRQDFCAFVQASLPGTNVTFTTRKVSTLEKEVERAVLRINLVPKPTPEGTRTNPLPLDKDVSIQDTETTQPLTVSTGAAAASDKTTIARAIVMRRCKADEVHLETSFEDRPHDEYTPTSSPQKKVNTSWIDEPSVDQPRETLNDEQGETLNEASDFVRNLSERIIRQTLADMDTINHGYGSSNAGTSGPTLRPSSATPFDEEPRHGAKEEDKQQQHLTEDDIQKCMLPSLPSLEPDKDYSSSERPTQPQIPFQAHPPTPPTGFGGVNGGKLEVIGQITTPNTTPKATPPPTVDKPAPVASVDVDHALKPCDGSVMSALSSPFEEHSPKPRDTIDVLEGSRPVIEIHTGFRTPVDALSLTDDKSVRIEGQEEEEEEEEEEGSVTADEEEEEEEEDEENPASEKSSSKRSSKQRPKSLRKAHVVEPDEMSQEGCVYSFFNVVCSLGAQEDAAPSRKSKKRSKHHRRRSATQEDDDDQDDDTPNTQSETDEEEPAARTHRRQKSSGRRRRSRKQKDADRMDSGEMITEIGAMADTVVEGIAASFTGMFGSSGAAESKRKSGHGRHRHSRGHNSGKGDDESFEASLMTDDIDYTIVDYTDGVDESTLEDTTLGSEEDIIRIVPEPRQREKQVRRHERPPLPAKHKGSRSGVRSPTSAGSENSLERIQEILRSKNSPGSSKRSANVKRNLELLQAADAPALGDFGTIGRISVVDSKETKQKGGARTPDRKKDNKKGLLGFLRKK